LIAIEAKGKPVGLDAPLDELGQARLVDFDLSGVQSIDSCAIYIRARDLQTKLREASSGDNTHISTADDADVHERLFPINADPLKAMRDEKACGSTSNYQ
jgi:hypothetical protein